MVLATSMCMRGCGNGVEWGVLGWVKRSTLWFGRIERIKNEKFVKMVYLSNVEGSSRRGRPLGRWVGRVKESLSARGVRGNGLEGQGGSGGGSSAVATTLGDTPGGSEVSELLID